jgi:hypothetical protein
VRVEHHLPRLAWDQARTNLSAEKKSSMAEATSSMMTQSHAMTVTPILIASASTPARQSRTTASARGDGLTASEGSGKSYR